MSDINNVTSERKQEIIDGFAAVVGGESDEPGSHGHINLIRAVYDHAQTVIDGIDSQLKRLDLKRQELLKERETHINMLNIAKEHVSSKVTI